MDETGGNRTGLGGPLVERRAGAELVPFALFFFAIFFRMMLLKSEAMVATGSKLQSDSGQRGTKIRVELVHVVLFES